MFKWFGFAVTKLPAMKCSAKSHPGSSNFIGGQARGDLRRRFRSWHARTFRHDKTGQVEHLFEDFRHPKGTKSKHSRA